MLDAEQSARRRELQRKAFSPGGSLSEGEAAELRTLNGAEPDHWVAEPVEATSGPSTSSGTQDAEGPSTSSGAQEATDSVPKRVHRPWRIALGFALAVLVGFGGGWFAATRDAGPLQMSDEQREVWTKLEASGDYDPGSIHLRGEKHGVTVWESTKNGSSERCLVAVRGEQQGAECRSDDDASEMPMQATLEYRDDGGHVMVWAVLADDVSGEPRAIVMRQVLQSEVWDWREQYSETEVPIAEVLDAAGHRGETLSIAGYDGDIPVWVSEDGETCLLLADSAKVIAEACTKTLYQADESLEVAVPGTTYSLRHNPSRGNVLTIIRTGETSATECEDCAVDDKTGETE